MSTVCKQTAEVLSRSVLNWRVSSTLVTRAWYECNEGNYDRVWDALHNGYAGVANMSDAEAEALYGACETAFWEYWTEQLLVIALPDEDPLLDPPQGSIADMDAWDDDDDDDWDLFSADDA